jgi:predicted nuclease of restriction endonuclease-like RecB superfamily
MKVRTPMTIKQSYSMANGGKREDLNNQYFRSSWEANYARYLNWLVERGEIAEWKFEPDTFEFTEIKRGNRFYTPDFKITNKDGSIEYHEVKGYMSEDSRIKLKRMAKYFSEIKLILIDKESYKVLSRQLRNIIPNWEWNEKHSY